MRIKTTLFIAVASIGLIALFVSKIEAYAVVASTPAKEATVDSTPELPREWVWQIEPHTFNMHRTILDEHSRRRNTR